jgi:hypothetical protein
MRYLGNVSVLGFNVMEDSMNAYAKNDTSRLLFSFKRQVILFIIFLSAGVAFGQTQNQFVLPRIHEPVILDGMSNEKAWENIEPLPMIMHIPHFGKQPSEKTEVRIGYDDDFLYLSGCLFDKEPSKIQAPSKKRDVTSGSNSWFGIIIDSFNDKENALAFFTTPLGLRLDMAILNDAQGSFMNASWNTFWDVKSVRNQEGWFVEMRIPFSSLRFQDHEGRVTMGLIIWRTIPRKNEKVIFPAIPFKWGLASSFKPSQAQEVVLEGIYSRKPLYVAPYILGGFEQTSELNGFGSEYHQITEATHEIGLDVKYGLTSNLTLDVTLNTDFAQVEADDQQINLTRFSLFFPEKRLFFQERSSNFDFNFEGYNRLFHSRRIGIYDGDLVRIYGGARLVGRVGHWDVGALTMQTAPVEGLSSENFSILRLRRQVINPYSYVGGIVTNRIGVDGTRNTAYGLDGIFRLYGDDYLTLKWAQTFDSDQDSKLFSLDPIRILLRWERRTFEGLGYAFDFSRRGNKYNPGMGFELRKDFTYYHNRILYGWIPGEKSALMRHHVFVDGFLILRNPDGSTESAEIGPGYEFETNTGYSSTISVKLFYEDVHESFPLSDKVDVPMGQYTFHGLDVYFETPKRRLISTSANLYFGTFYDGWRAFIGVSPYWGVSSSLELSGSYQYNRIVFPDRNQQYTGQIARLRVVYMLSTKLSISSFIQFNSVIEGVIANFRLRYNPREGNDFYLVYNDDLNTNRHREIPALPFTNSRTVLLKYTYTFTL